MKIDFYTLLLAFYLIIITTILVLVYIPSKISCDSDNACAYDNAYLKCTSGGTLGLIPKGECDEGTYGYLVITFCSFLLLCIMLGWGLQTGLNKLPKNVHAKFLIYTLTLLIAAFGIGAASMRYVLLTEFYESKQ